MEEKFYGKKQYYEMWYSLLKEALLGMNIGAWQVGNSGEKNVLELLKSRGGTQILFDVGANVGDYTKLLMDYFPEATIHCFEPAKKTFQKLRENVQNSNVILNNMGISDEVTEKRLYYDEEGSGMASLYHRELDYLGIDFSLSESVRLDTLDNYCKKNNIETIDLLKMDIEGNELKALKGADLLLKQKRIKNIQIEFGGCNIDSRTYFKDFWNLLHQDFEVYRILQDGLWRISGYSEKLECFVTTNYLFVQR